MVVSDLHGDWDAYRRYRDRFVDLQAKGGADYLILTGDLIHGEGPGPSDKSLAIVLDVLALREAYGASVIYLCGNHEMPHIYGISLSKGRRDYTPAFEAALSQSGQRTVVMTLFDALPFYVRTKAGVSLTHAGACAAMADPQNADQLFNWSHQEVMAWADEKLPAQERQALRAGYAELHQTSYDMLAGYYLAVSGPDDPRYDDLLRGFFVSKMPTFERLLWPALFTRCEQTYGPDDYAIFLEAILRELSSGFYPQHLLIAGHITIQGGHQIVAKRHLRLASAPHATPRQAGQYLLFDTAQPIQRIEALQQGLASVF